MIEQLTPEKIKKLRFAMHMHLNRGREHDLVRANYEYGLYITATSTRPQFKIIRKVLSFTTETGKVVEADLLAKDKDSQLARFCVVYNKHKRTASTPYRSTT